MLGTNGTGRTLFSFLNTIEGFKFMVNLKWINHHAVNGIDHAPAAIKKLHDKFNGMKSPPPKKLSLAVNDLKT